MKRKALVALALAAFGMFGFSQAGAVQPSNAAQAKTVAAKPSQKSLDVEALTKIAQIWFNGMPVDSVKESQYPGLYEIKTPRGFFYMNAGADWIVAGDLIDVASKENITRQRIRDSQKFEFSKLPLENTFKLVRGKGTRKMVVFADPNCSFCKRMEGEYDKLDDVTIYVMPYAMLSQDSETKIKTFWCSADPSAEWFKYMKTGVMPKAKDCATADKRVKAIQELAFKMHVRSTPSVFLQSNTRVDAALEASAIEAKLAGR